MKKTMPLILLLFLVIQNVISPYNVTPNQSFDYDVKKAEVYVKLDGNSNSGKGYIINDVHFNQKTSIQATVDSLGGDNVLWTLTSNDESLVKLADWNLVDESTLSSIILNPFSIIQSFLSNPTLATDGLGLIFYPFLGTNRTIQFFKDLKNQTHYQYVFFESKIDDFLFDAFYEENDELIIFESLITGNLNQNTTTPEFTLIFKHQSQLVYDVSIGVLYGSRFYSEGSGVFENKTAEFRFESHIELSGYNLPKPNFVNYTSPIRWIIIGVSGSIILIVLSVLIIRFRKRKLR